MKSNFSAAVSSCNLFGHGGKSEIMTDRTWKLFAGPF